MKPLSKIFTIISFCCFISCTGYGEKLLYQKTEVYYTDKVEKADAEKLGNYLVKSEFVDDNEKSIQLTKNEYGRYAFRMVTTEKAAKDKTYEPIFKTFAKEISDSVFNKQPIDFHVCNNAFETLKIISFDKSK